MEVNAVLKLKNELVPCLAWVAIIEYCLRIMVIMSIDHPCFIYSDQDIEQHCYL